MEKWIVYRHVSPSKKVYIGITCQTTSKRWKNGLGYFSSPYFFSAIVKYGWINIKHEVLFEGLPEKRAKDLEISLIRHYKNLGISYNVTDGGEGVVGIKYDANHCSNLSKVVKKWYETHDSPMKNKHHTEEAKRRMSERHKEWFQNEENRLKYSKAKKKAIILISLEEKQKEIPSLMETAAYFSCNKKTIHRHIKEGTPYKNYYMYFKNEYLRRH